MKVGVFASLTDRGVRIDQLARAVEERGFDSVWLAEHTHMPVGTVRHADGPPELSASSRMPDPLIQLAAAAAVTSKIGLGTSICLLAQHDPIVMAKQVATLDYLSNGRVRLGVGYGWNRVEAQHHGLDFDARRAVFREKLLAMRQLWEKDVAEFDGTHVQFGPSYSWPKPVQSRLPVLIGAEVGPKTAAHIVELAEGWLPMTLRSDEAKIMAQLEILKTAAAKAGRPLDTLDITLHETPLLRSGAGEPAQFGAQLAALPGRGIVETHGFSGLVIGLPLADWDRSQAYLDAAAAHYFG
jgi:probable F420-dependent oxidoreductase